MPSIPRHHAGLLQAIAQDNPLTYEVAGLQALTLGSDVILGGLTLDLAVLLVVIGGRLYPRLAVW